MKYKYLNHETLLATIDWSYEKVLTGFAGTDSAIDLAENYLKTSDSKEDAVKKIIRWQISKAGTSGFLTGLGGIILMPATIPANIASIFCFCSWE